MPSNNNTLSPTNTSQYNYERVGTISPTLASLVHQNGNPRYQTSTLLNGHKMNGNLSRNGNAMRYPNGISPSKVSPNITNTANISQYSAAKQPLLDISRTATNLQTSPHLNGSRIGPHSPKASNDYSNSDSEMSEHGLHQVLASLALMCLLSLLMAFLALFFLQRTCPISALTDSTDNEENSSKVNKNLNQMPMRIVSNSREYVRVFQISVSLSTLTISLDLCCLFVSCIQFLSAVKLMNTPFGRKSTPSTAAKGAELGIEKVAIKTIGVILFTFVNFDEVPALATSVIIGLAIIFCGIASVQNVYLWQWEKTKASQERSESRIIHLRDSGYLPSIELSTLV
ncbi:unnamed protein product [Medioppia subpectinata]|uniref:Uncharacterized protein n=1 Tax=Medioppia subpectinata TaxID=1979941 RepID=A0A7R9Q703_9ACAR|nr:unnamed protein product [Medioppia subpectinata]CAG2115199.1 unnamed protein product [Medioppia subpectinata]